MRSWYTGRWWVGCYIWYSEEGPGSRPVDIPLFAVPNVTAHPSMASVPITVLLQNGPLLCGFNVAIKGLISYSWENKIGRLSLLPSFVYRAALNWISFFDSSGCRSAAQRANCLPFLEFCSAKSAWQQCWSCWTAGSASSSYLPSIYLSIYLKSRD